MSFPVQVVIHGAAVRATAEAVCRRVGVRGSAPVAWPLVWDDQPKPATRLAAAARRMLEAWGSAGEGGWGRVIIAGSVDALSEVAASRAWSPHAPGGRRRGAEDAQATSDREAPGPGLNLSVGIALGGASEPAAGLPVDALDAVFVVPAALPGRRLTAADRVQIAGNLLGLVLELARLEDARRTARRFVQAYPGAHSALATVARFNAPAIRHVLAARLAASVTGRMVDALRRAEGPPPTALHELRLPDAVFVARALTAEAPRVAARLAGDGADDLDAASPPDAGALEEHAATLIARLAAASTQAASGWLDQLRAEVDRALATGTFGAIAPALGALDALDAALAQRISRFDLPPGRLTPLRPPSSAAVTEAAEDLAAARRDDAPTSALFGAWVLAAAATAAVAIGPFLPAPTGPSLAWLPGGAFTLVGAAALCLGGVIGGLRRRARGRLLGRLELALGDARRDRRVAWARALEAHLGAVGALLERRALRRLRAGVRRERRLLSAVADAVVRLEERFRREATAPRPVERPFDSDVAVDQAFYEAAALGAPPEEHHRRAEDALAHPGWRDSLAFLDGDRLLAECAAAFSAFDEGVPLSRREDLCAAVGPAATAAIATMSEHLARLVPLSDTAARLLMVPPSLGAATPAPLDAATELWPGVGDLFAAVLTRAP